MILFENAKIVEFLNLIFLKFFVIRPHEFFILFLPDYSERIQNKMNKNPLNFLQIILESSFRKQFYKLF